LQTNVTDFIESKMLIPIIQKFYPYCVCLLLCFLAYKKHWLTLSGAVAAFGMAVVFILVGLRTFYLPLLLLLGGTLLSKLNAETEDKQGRDAKQVLANGLIGIICLLLYVLHFNDTYQSPLLLAYLLSFSISICDTFSSERGKYFKGKTIDILSFKPIASGLSGGISVQGTLGGLAGSIFCATISFFCFDITLCFALVVCLLSFTGMLFDSILGSLLQAKYVNRNGVIEENSSDDNHLLKGYIWCSNDVVNLMSNLIVVSFFLLGLSLM